MCRQDFMPWIPTKEAARDGSRLLSALISRCRLDDYEADRHPWVDIPGASTDFAGQPRLLFLRRFPFRGIVRQCLRKLDWQPGA